MPHDRTSQPWTTGPRLAWIALAATLLLVFFLEIRSAPPTPVDADAPTEAFSAARAVGVIERILGADDGAHDGAIGPHPTGSDAAREVRRRVESEIRALGLEAEIHRTVACRSSSRVSAVGCAPVENVVARLPAPYDGPGPAVVLMAHYDSVAAGPGVSDDAVGVAAVLETARALLAAPVEEARNPVWLLLTDAEEVGLYGARGFADDHSLATEGDIGIVVNVEARGTTGQSLLFQTSEDDAWLVDVYRGAPRPATSSLYAEIYRRLPNDTDLSVFLDAGVAGMNFAYAEGLPRYHTPRDDLEHLHRGSLQHHGDNLLHVTRRLVVRSDLADPPPGRAVYADVAGLFVVAFSLGWVLPLAIVALVGMLGVAVVSIRRREVGWRELALAVSSAFLVLPVTVVFAVCLGFLVETVTGSTRAAWAHPFPFRTALWTAAFLAPFAVARAGRSMARRLGTAPTPESLGLATGLLLAVFAVVAALYVPGVSLFLVPAFVALLAGGAARLSGRRVPADAGPVGTVHPAAVAAIVTALATAFFWLPIARFVELGLGLHQASLIGVPLGVVALAYAPIAARPGSRRIAAVLAAGCAVGLVGALVVSPYSVADPQGVNVVHHEDAAEGTAHLFVDASADPPPAALFEASGAQGAELSREAVDTPWGLRLGRAHAAELGAASPAEAPLEVLEVDAEAGRIRLRIRPGALAPVDWLRLVLPAESHAETVRVGSREMALQPDAPYRDHHVFTCSSRACEGLEITFDVGSVTDADGEPLVLEAFAVRYAHQPDDLPAAARAVAGARPEWSVPVHRGDVRTWRWTVPLVAPAVEPDAGSAETSAAP